MKKKKKIARKDHSNVIQLLLFRYLPYWPLFAALSCLFIIIGWTYLQIATPKYKVTATLLIKDEKKGVESAQMVESLNILNSKKIVENEIEVIKSKTLLRHVVEALHLSSPIYEEQFMTDKLAYSTCPVTVESDNSEKKLKVGDRIYFSYDSKANKILLEGAAQPLDVWLPSVAGKIRFTKNKYLTEASGGPFYVTFINPKQLINDLSVGLTVQPSNKLSTVINLSLNDEVPMRGENILNTLIKAYNDAGINDKNILAASTLEFVEDRIKVAERDLDSLERSIELYKSTRGIVDLSEQGKVFLKNVGDNDQKLSSINMQLAVLKKLEDYVVGKGSTAKIVPSNLGIDEAGLAKLVQKLYDSEIEYERLKRTTAENNPILLTLKNEIDNLRPGVMENIQNQKQSLIASRSNLSSTNNRYASQLETIPQKEKELLEATRQQAIKNDVYTFLLQKREETILSSASAAADSRIVDEAESSLTPVSPKKLLVYVGCIAAAFALSIAWVTKKEVFGRYILFKSEIESSTTLPIASEIFDTHGKGIVVADSPSKGSLVSEQFKHLAAAIGCYAANAQKVLTVTSAISGEGKSFISINIAITLANSGKKVLLVDMDLRSPRITKSYNMADLPGIADYLTNGLQFDKMIRKTVTPKLMLVPAGTNRSNPIELVSSEAFRECLNKFRLLFDYIIIDTPPILPVTDAHTISQMGDATLFVLRHGRTPKQIVRTLDEKTKMLKNTSLVFNGIKPRGIFKQIAEYGYGDSYGYGSLYPDSYPIGQSPGRSKKSYFNFLK